MVDGSIAPAVPVLSVTRRYRGPSLVLETEFTTERGIVRVVDCMPPRETQPDLIRLVEGVGGEVPMRMELVIRFDHGSVVPWVRSVDGVLTATAGPDALSLWSPIATEGVGLDDTRGFRRAVWRSGSLRASLASLSRRQSEARRWHRRGARDRGVVAHLVGPVHVPGTVAQRGGALGDHPEGADVCANRRHCRGRDDVAA